MNSKQSDWHFEDLPRKIVRTRKNETAGLAYSNPLSNVRSLVLTSGTCEGGVNNEIGRKLRSKSLLIPFGASWYQMRLAQGYPK
jgi:hypothetical protein